MKWLRPSGNPIELKDTPEMEELATSNGWTKVHTKPVKKSKKNKKAE